ncbi:MAG: hypothetical protein N2112_15395 [Gemmataceae bacterium]|jgi:hypothetical protein|nr:hypothetical protein [Gemmataceae bacterium]
MRRLVSVNLITLVVIILASSDESLRMKRVYAGKEKRHDWTSPEGVGSYYGYKNCQRTNFKCFALPNDICIEAKLHPTVCGGVGGIKLIQQLAVGYCKTFQPSSPIEIPDGCTQFQSINVAKAECYTIYDGEMKGAECRGKVTVVYCNVNAAALGPGYVCLPDYD